MTGGSNGADPGLQYLYSSSKASKPPQQRSSTAAGAPEPVLVMAPLPRDPTESGNSRDWNAAVGNVETAKLALDTLRGLIADAVFLDEDAYTNAATLQHYHQRLQVGHHDCRHIIDTIKLQSSLWPAVYAAATCRVSLENRDMSQDIHALACTHVASHAKPACCIRM
jgi:hypothetical protein